MLADREAAIRDREQKLSAILAGVDAAVYLIDGNLSYLYANRKLGEIFGIAPEVIVGRRVDDFLDTDSAAAISRSYATIWQEGGIQRTESRWKILRDGREHTFLSVGQPLYDEQGNVYAIIGISTDITERIDQESRLVAANVELSRHRDHLDDLVRARTRELAHARDLAESANRAKTALLSNVSHELKTPLNHIVGYSSILGSAALGASALEQVQVINTAAYSLLKLVDNLIDLAALEARELQLHYESFSLRALLQQEERRLHPAIVEAGLEYESAVDNGVPDGLRSDPQRLGQVLEILLDNAVKFSRQGRISVRCQQQSLHVDHVVLRFEVEDQGIGMDEPVKNSLFMLFEQGDGSSTRRYGGTGIGLSLARRLVNLLLGDMGVESWPGKGSRFWFTVSAELVTGELPEDSARPGK